jgi:hypothetical protein
MWHAWGRKEVFTGFWLVGPKVRDHWEDLGVGVYYVDKDPWGELEVQDRVQWRVSVKNGNEPSGFINKAGYSLEKAVTTFQIMSCTTE